MVDEVPINAPVGATRSPRRVAWLAALTLGIYAVVWFYRFGREINAAGSLDLEPKRWYKQLAILAGFLVTLPVALVHFFVYAHRVATATERLARRLKITTVDVEGHFPVLIIPFVGVTYIAHLQREGNKIWARMRERREARERALEEAKRRKPQPVEQLIQCPQCNHIVTVRFLPGETPMARCENCGFSAPYEAPGPTPG